RWALAPVLRKICGAVSRRLPALISRGETKLADSLMISRVLRPPSQSVRLWTEAPTTRSLRALTAFISTAIGPLMVTPKAPACRADQAMRALATRVLVGVQPSL